MDVHDHKDGRMPKYGDVVVYVDPVGSAQLALVTAVWGSKCVNIVFVSKDSNKSDPFGRQIERQTSLVHQTLQPAHGSYWRWQDEEPKVTERQPL